MKILDHILNTIIQEQVSINNMQFCFMPGREKYLQKKKKSTLNLLT